MRWNQRLQDIDLSEVVDNDHIVIRSNNAITHSNTFATMSVSELHELLLYPRVHTGTIVYHELAHEYGPQRLRFDVETESTECISQLKDLYANIELGILNELASSIVDVLSSLLNVSIHIKSRVDNKRMHTIYIEGDIQLALICLISSGSTKLSAHYILSGLAIPHATAVRWLANKTISSLQHIKYVFDTGIYTRNHSLRVIGCSKNGRLMGHTSPAKHALYLSLVTYCSADTNISNYYVALPEESVSTLQHADISEVPNEAVNAVLSACDSQFIVRNTLKKDNSTWIVNLTRVEPSYCNICSRIHSNEHPQVSVSSKDGLSVSWNCRRSTTWLSLLSQKTSNADSRPYTFSSYVLKYLYH